MDPLTPLRKLAGFLARGRARRRQVPSSNRICLRCEGLETRTTPSTGVISPRVLPLPDSWTGVSEMIELSDGDVLAQRGGADVNGGVTKDWYLLKPDARGDYALGTWGPAMSMNLERLFYPSNLLPDGSVFVLGGEFAGPNDASDGTNTAEIYDPAANHWSYTPTTQLDNYGLDNYGDAPTELLPNGQILAGNIGQGLNPSVSAGATFLYTPGTATTAASWSPSGTKAHASDESGEESWALLPDAGQGASVLSYDIWSSYSDGMFEADRYIVAGGVLPGGGTSTGQWVDASTVSTSNPPSPLGLSFNGGQDQEIGPALLLPDGRVFQLGGNGNTAFYTPNNSGGLWSAGPTMPTVDGSQFGYSDHPQLPLSAADAPAAVLPNGKVLMALSPLTTAEIPFKINAVYLYEYDPATNAYTQVPLPMGEPDVGVNAYNMHMLDLPNGHVLISFGTDLNNSAVWDYVPDGAPQDAWRPTIDHITANANGSYTLFGTQLTGLSEGAAFGDDAEMSTNYPIVKLTEGGLSWYAKTINWTPGVAAGAGQVDFTLPKTTAPGLFSVQVIANGIPSAPYDLTTPTYSAAYWVDTRWQGLTSGQQINDVDPVEPGNQGGTIGVNAFGSVMAAVTAAANNGVDTIVINGDAGGGTGDFSSEAVKLSGIVSLYLQAGMVKFGSLATAPAGTSGDLAIASGASLVTGYDGTNTEFDGSIIGPGSLTKTGSGNFTVTGAISPLGGLTINSGKVILGSAQAAGSLSGTTVNLSSGLGLNISDFPSVVLGGLGGSVDLNIGTTALTVGADDDATTYSGTITSANNTGTLIKVGAGALTLSGTGNSLVGGTTINAGTLLVNGSIAAGSGRISANNTSTLRLGSANALAAVTVNVSNAAVLDFNNFATVTLGGLGGSAPIAMGATAVTFGSDGDSTVYSGMLTGSGNLTKVGAGSLSFTDGADPGYIGGVTISAGSIALLRNTTQTSADELVGSTVTVAGGVLDVTQPGHAAIGGLAGSGNINLAATALTVGGNNASTTFSGALSGSGSLVKVGTGALILAGANTYSGGTTVSAGTLQIGDGGTSGAVMGNAVDNAALVFDRSDAITYSGVISGRGTVTQIGTGTLTLANTNTFSGGLNLNAGTVSVASDGNLGDPSVGLSFNGGTLEASDSFSSARSMAVNDPGGTIQVDDSKTLTLSGTIGNGSGNLTTAGTGTVAVTGTNNGLTSVTVSAGTVNLTGQINMYQGTFTIGSSGTLSGTGRVYGSVVVSGTLDSRQSTAATPLTTSALTFSGGTLLARLYADGTTSSQVLVNGGLDLTGGATLVVQADSGFTTTSGQVYDLVDMFIPFLHPTGTFTNLADGTVIQIGGYNFVIHYRGVDGNDIVLVAQ